MSFEIGAQTAKALRDRLQKNSKTIPETGILLSRSGTSNTAPLRVLIGIYIESMGNFQATDMVIYIFINLEMSTYLLSYVLLLLCTSSIFYVCS